MKKITLIILSLVLMMSAVCCSSNPVEPQEVSVNAVIDFSKVKLMKGDKVYFTAEWQFKGEPKQYKDNFTVNDPEMKTREVSFKPRKVAGSMKVSVIRPFDTATKDTSEGYEFATGEEEIGEFTQQGSYTVQVKSVDEYLTFTGKDVTVTPDGWKGLILEYSTDGTNWTTIKNGTTTPKASFVKFRGTNGTVGSGGTAWKIGGYNVSVSGNIMKVLDYHNPPSEITSAYCFGSMFESQSSLTDASGLNLSATTLNNYCYSYMFSSCTKLTTAPSLPATNLANFCYSFMFYNCTALKVSTSGEAYQKIFECPSTYGLMEPVKEMFTGTSGTFKGTPVEDGTYYWN